MAASLFSHFSQDVWMDCPWGMSESKEFMFGAQATGSAVVLFTEHQGKTNGQISNVMSGVDMC